MILCMLLLIIKLLLLGQQYRRWSALDNPTVSNDASIAVSDGARNGACDGAGESSGGTHLVTEP